MSSKGKTPLNEQVGAKVWGMNSALEEKPIRPNMEMLSARLGITIEEMEVRVSLVEDRYEMLNRQVDKVEKKHSIVAILVSPTHWLAGILVAMASHVAVAAWDGFSKDDVWEIESHYEETADEPPTPVLDAAP